MPTLQDLFSQYPRLTRKQRSILDHLREHPDEATYITLKSLAAKAGVSEVSILRLCRALGFGGFQELKEQFREELDAGTEPVDPDDEPPEEQGEETMTLPEMRIAITALQEENARLAEQNLFLQDCLMEMANEVYK